MKQLIYIHGGDRFRSDDDFCAALQRWEYEPFLEKKKWSNGLKESLKNDYVCYTPEMPNKHYAKYTFWKIWFEKIIPFLNDEELVMIGWSLGGMFLIKYLGENTFPKKIKQLHLVATSFDESDVSEEEKYVGDFAYSPGVISHLQDQAEEIYIYHSKDDDIVPYAHAEKIKSYLHKAKLITFNDRGHFWQPEFPELLENIGTYKK